MQRLRNALNALRIFRRLAAVEARAEHGYKLDLALRPCERCGTALVGKHPGVIWIMNGERLTTCCAWCEEPLSRAGWVRMKSQPNQPADARA